MTSSEASSSEAEYHHKLKFIKICKLKDSKVVYWIQCRLYIAKEWKRVTTANSKPLLVFFSPSPNAKKHVTETTNGFRVVNDGRNKQGNIAIDPIVIEEAAKSSKRGQSGSPHINNDFEKEGIQEKNSRHCAEQ